MTLDLNDPRLAQLLTDMVDRRVRAALDTQARIRYGIVAAVDTGARTASLLLGGSATPSPGFVYPASSPPTVGDTVRAVNRGADRYIDANLTAAAAGSTGPRGVLGYAEVTANQTGITTEADLTGLSVSVTVAAGRRIRVTGQVRYGGTTSDDVATLRIKEGTISIQTAQLLVSRATGQANPTLTTAVVLTPSAGSHTYKLSLERPIGTGNMQLVASSNSPAFILVEDIDPA
jgi:hypothetical protein